MYFSIVVQRKVMCHRNEPSNAGWQAQPRQSSPGMTRKHQNSQVKTWLSSYIAVVVGHSLFRQHRELMLLYLLLHE
jgi:hypothetical protein